MKFVSYAFLVLLTTLILLGGCKKEETVISGNQAPEDPTVSNILMENYVQKVFLNLVGRQPSDSEKTTGLAILNKNNCSLNNRTQLLELLFNSEEYPLQLYAIENTDMLEGLSDKDINETVKYYQEELDDPANFSDYTIIAADLKKTQLLDSLKENMINGSVDLVTAHKIITNSPSYENIVGSGSEWTASVFKRFLFREPTEKEIENCDDMFDAMSAILFLFEGSSKEDMINIFFSSDEYFEGQVRTVYQRYLFREPEANIEASLTQQYKLNHDYKALQKKILLSDEFLGLN